MLGFLFIIEVAMIEISNIPSPPVINPILKTWGISTIAPKPKAETKIIPRDKRAIEVIRAFLVSILLCSPWLSFVNQDNNVFLEVFSIHHVSF